MEREMERSDGPTASRADGKGSSRCQQDGNSQDGQIEGYPYLPEDILCHIHSLMPMRDAVRFARVSQAFLLSWRCHPNLAFSCSIKTLLALKENACRRDEIARDSVSQVDRILKNHSGIGVKTFRLHLPSICEKNLCHPDLLDSWLQIAVTPGIEELILTLSFLNAKYNNFPCSLLSDGTRESLRYLFLSSCNFHPTAGLGCLRSLSRLQLYTVHITDGELGCLLSNSFALERLELRYCDKLICLKIPCLQRLSYLEVLYCTRLQVIESKAPKLSSFNFAGGLDVQISFGDTSRIKKLDWYCSNGALYARTELPSSMPNLETLTVYSKREMANTPMMPSKFLHLKFLCIVVGRGTPGTRGVCLGFRRSLRSEDARAASRQTQACADHQSLLARD